MTPTFTVTSRPGVVFSLRSAPGAGDMIFEALGVDSEAIGVRTGRFMPMDFMGRVTLALSIAPLSPARPKEVTKKERGAFYVKSELQEGYLQNFLQGLYEIAVEAYNVGVPVHWSL